MCQKKAAIKIMISTILNIHFYIGYEGPEHTQSYSRRLFVFVFKSIGHGLQWNRLFNNICYRHQYIFLYYYSKSCVVHISVQFDTYILDIFLLWGLNFAENFTEK